VVNSLQIMLRNDLPRALCAAVCGAWWSGPICADGTPSGYVVYEVDGESLRWRYQATGEAEDHGLRVYPTGADPAAPGEVVANVWDWDPEWRVTWLEGEGDLVVEATDRFGRVLSGAVPALEEGVTVPRP
jgi:hypothetical protein